MLDGAPMVHAGPGERSRAAWVFGAALTALLLLGLALRLNGLGISFWMDEAWVANSLLEPTWTGLFHYREWLQTTPPGFLTLAAWAVAVFGQAPAAFRLLPLIAGLVGLGAVAALSRRLSPGFGLLAVLLVALSPTAADYSRMLKQYSVELAVAALLIVATWRYVERPTRTRVAALAATLGIGLTCAYGAVFTVGGVLALTSPVGLMLIGRRVERTDVVRWAGLIAVALVVLGVEYVMLYRPNTSPELRRFWYTISINRRDADPLQTLFRHLVMFVRQMPVPAALHGMAIVAGVAVTATGAVIGLRDRARRETTVVLLALGGLPALAILGSGLLDLYPNFERTGLFLLPGLALLLAWNAQVLCEAARICGTRTPAARPLGAVTAALFAVAGVAMIVDGVRNGLAPVSPREDYEASVRYLGAEARDGDLVFVHACCSEGFRLYRTLQPWTTQPAVALGETGQPCCRPGRPVVRHPLDRVGADIRRHVSAGFRGRVWIFSSDRADYWRYSSLAPEGPVLRAALQADGCRWNSERLFVAMRVDMLDCSGR
jgi:hypothetical protein